MTDSALFAQLQRWRAKGFDPQLWGTPDGWVVILDMTKWGMDESSPRKHTMLLRFNSNKCDTPEAAIEDTLKVIQP